MLTALTTCLLLTATPAGASRPASATPEIQEAIDRGRAWLDRLDVDVAELQANGIKGKKKLGELLGAYWDLFRHESDPQSREVIRTRVESLARQTRRPEYHDLLTCTERELREGSMSYLRVLRLLEEFGLDTASYHARLREAQPRIDAHLSSRGSWQRSVFATYYDRFGLDRPAALDDAARPPGVIASRTSFERLTRTRSYQLTHEVFAAFDYGNRASQDVFDDDDLAYVRRALSVLGAASISRSDPDLLAEVLACQSYLGMTDDPVHARGIASLVEVQNGDGSWGSYSRGRHGPFVDQKLHLHTTHVALRALIAERASTAGTDAP